MRCRSKILDWNGNSPLTEKWCRMWDFFGPIIFWGILIIGALCSILAKIKEADDERRMENLKYTDPQAYAQLKQIEHEQQLMEHDQKRMQHENRHTGAKIVTEIFRAIFK